MKRILLLVLLTTKLLQLNAQNWLPVSPNGRLSFRHSGNSLIDQEIEVTGKKILANGDSSWQLNTVARTCDTCSDRAFWRNHGQMLQKQLVFRNNGELYLQGIRPCLLMPLAPPATSWLFDTLNNLTALISSIELATVLGQADSVKTITLSNGQEIRLSRRHGIILWPDFDQQGAFELAGIEALGLGTWTPRWKDFYDFSIGDIFQYQGSFTQEAGTANNAYTFARWTILEKGMDADTLVYKTERWNLVSYFGIPSIRTRDTVLQRIHPALTTPWSESWPNQLWHLANFQYPLPDSIFAVSRFYESPMVGLSKSLGGRLDMDILAQDCNIMSASHPENPDLLGCDGCVQFVEQLSVGLGHTRHQLGCFEYFENSRLDAWVKNGDTTGFLLPLSFFTKTYEPSNELPLSITPNPTHSDWQIKFEQPLSESVPACLLDVHGRVIYQFHVEQGETSAIIHGINLASGVYFLQLNTKAAYDIRRLIKL